MEHSLELSRIVSKAESERSEREPIPRKESLQTILDEFNRRDEPTKHKRMKKISKTTHPISENKLLQNLQLKHELQIKSRQIEQSLKPRSLRGFSHDPQKKTLSSYIGKSSPMIMDSPQEVPRHLTKKSYVSIINQEDLKPKVSFKPIELSKYADEIQQEPSLLGQQIFKQEAKPNKFLSVPSLVETNEAPKFNALKLNIKSSSGGSLPGSWTSRERLPSRGSSLLSSLDPSPKARIPFDSFTARHANASTALLPMSNDYLLKIILNKNESQTPRNNVSSNKLELPFAQGGYQFAKRGSFAVFKTVIDTETLRK